MKWCQRLQVQVAAEQQRKRVAERREKRTADTASSKRRSCNSGDESDDIGGVGLRS